MGLELLEAPIVTTFHLSRLRPSQSLWLKSFRLQGLDGYSPASRDGGKKRKEVFILHAADRKKKNQMGVKMDFLEEGN